MNYKKAAITFLTFFYLELVLHLLLFKNLNFKSFFYILIFISTFSLIIDLITNVFKNKTNKILYLIFTIFFTCLFIAQLINFSLYGNIFSIYSLFHGGQVFGWFTTILSILLKKWYQVLIIIIPAVLICIFYKKIDAKKQSYKNIGIEFLLFIIITIFSLLSLNFDSKEIYSAKNLYFNKHVPNPTAQIFGIVTTMRLDLSRIIMNFQENSTVNTNMENTTVDKVVEYNKLEIDFDSLTSKKETIKNIDAYISRISATEKNEYTGLFKGKNLISIVAEAFSPIAVNESLTPTLYKLVNSGFVFKNFYTPVYYVSTSDGEYVTLTSLLPKESVWSFSKSSTNYLPYTYGNVFKDLNYATYAFHDGEYKFYNRHKSHPNMGYTYKACGNGLQKLMNCKKWPQSDIEMINSTFDIYSNNENFAVYYMTISGHLEYNFYGNNIAYKNKSLVNNLPYSTAVKAYLATQIELDRALASLINKLEEKQILDDTVIVLSSDHYPYGLSTNEMKEVSDFINDDKFDTQKNNLIIWNSELTNTIEINKYAQSLDILPTVLNLFGINFDSRLLMGSDILSNSDGLVILNDRSWITSYGKYNASSDIFTPLTTDELPDDYVENINNVVYNKFIISKNILETNYYKHVLGE